MAQSYHLNHAPNDATIYSVVASIFLSYPPPPPHPGLNIGVNEQLARNAAGRVCNNADGRYMIEAALQGDDAARLPPGQVYIPTIPSPQRVRAARLSAITLVCFAFSVSKKRLPQLYSYFVEYFATEDREEDTVVELEKWVDEMSGESAWGDLLLGRGLASLLTAQIFAINGNDQFLGGPAWMLPLEVP